MNKMNFERLATVRLEEAKTLLAAGFWDGAYYLAGYAVECVLKACLCQKTERYDFPPKMKVVGEYYSHEYDKLLKQAGLTDSFLAARRADEDLETAWTIVSKWDEESRYKHSHTEQDARTLIEAISDSDHGVLTWFTNQSSSSD